MVSQRTIKKAGIISLIVFIVFSIIGFFVLPPVIKSVLADKLSEALHRNISIGSIKVNPYTLSVTINDVVIKERDSSDNFLTFSKLYLNLNSFSAVRSGIVVDEIYLENPSVRIVRRDAQTYNFSDLIKKTDEKKPKDKPFRFSINNIQLAGGRVEFIDELKNTRHHIKDIVITLPFVSNRAYYVETYIEPHFSAVINDTLFIMQGKTKPFANSMETELNLNVKNIDLPYYLAYLPARPKAKIESALFSTAARISYKQYKDKQPSLSITGDFNLDKLSIKDAKNSGMVSVPSIALNIDSSELMEKKVHIAKFIVDSPFINVVRSADSINLMDLMLPKSAEAQKSAAAGKKDEAGQGAKQFIVEAADVQLRSGRVAFSDSSLARPFKTELKKIDVAVTNFSNQADAGSQYKASLETESNERLNLSGSFVLAPFSVDGEAGIKSVPLAKYRPYYEDRLNFDIESGMLDLSAAYSVSEKRRTISSLSADLKALVLKKRDANEPFVSIASTSLRKSEIDLSARSIRLGELRTSQGMVRIIRSKDSSMNLQNLIASKQQAVSAQDTAVEKQKDAQPDAPWMFSAGLLKASGYQVEFEDNSTFMPVKTKVSDIELSVKNISTKKESKGEFSAALKLNDTGKIESSGIAGLEPMTVDAKINANSIGISPFQPYFTDKFRVLVTRGDISASGSMSGSYEKGKEPAGLFKGEVVVTDFATVEKAGAADFLKWNALALSEMEVSMNPNRVIINKVSLTDFYSKIAINSDGTSNLQKMMADKSRTAASKTAAAKTEPAPKQPEPVKKESEPGGLKTEVRVDQITMQAGTIDFSDNFIKPSYAARLTEIGGSVSGITMDRKKPADLNLRGKFDQYAPLEITGKLYPFPDDLFINLDFRFRDMDLSPVSPYSGKYIGYHIQKGKLNFDLKYSIVKRKLEAQNNILLDQLTLGERVDSPTATKLPVKLAIALLKNRKGEIDLDVPVSGSLDDPKFSVGSIILKVIVNLLVKAATSPFALLGALFGGGEELSYMEFDYASSAITAADAKKLDNLVKALADRPGLKLEIEGYVDAEKDKAALVQLTFQRKIKAQKLKQLAKTGAVSVKLDDIKIDQKEYADLLKAAYKEERFPKPRNIIGMAKSLPGPEMEKLMLTHIKITEDDLRQLAKSRASAVKDYIIKSGKVEQQRVFLIETKSLAPEKKQKLKDSRAEFKLK
ncbi:MAG: DUF748 domain-containing protein [Nitrospiraceae bacterium]|nr:DUF748 domain-containing protein [Nitrospiraceae bacterium]